MHHYYLYLNSITPDVNFEFAKNNFVYSELGSALAKNEKFKRENNLLENFDDHIFMVMQTTDSKLHDLFKLASLLTSNNMWAFNYFLFFSDRVENNFPHNLSMYPRIANLSLAQQTVAEQPISRFTIEGLQAIKLKMEELEIFFKKHPKFKSKFFNTYYFICNSHHELRKNTDLPKSLLSLIMGFESLLNFKSTEPICKSISTRLKIIHQNDIHSGKFKMLYDLRSKFIHGDIENYLKLAKKNHPSLFLSQMTLVLIQSLNNILKRNISINELINL